MKDESFISCIEVKQDQQDVKGHIAHKSSFFKHEIKVKFSKHLIFFNRTCYLRTEIGSLVHILYGIWHVYSFKIKTAIYTGPF